MEVFLILPETQSGKHELQKTLARFHAEEAWKMLENLPCPADQKTELADAVIRAIRSEADPGDPQRKRKVCGPLKRIC